MSTRYLEVALRGYRGIDDVISAAEFSNALRASAEDERIRIEQSEHPGQAARILFLTATTRASGEQALQELLLARLANAVSWLSERREEIGRVRSSGLQIDLYFDIGLDKDSFSLELPAAFVSECGRNELPILVGGLNYKRATR